MASSGQASTATTSDGAPALNSRATVTSQGSTIVQSPSAAFSMMDRAVSAMSFSQRLAPTGRPCA